MSSREPMWYCHECNAEMRPLMVPDPHCASCNGTFVEKMENPDDDPREFHNAPGAFPEDAFGTLDFLAGLQELLRPEPPPSHQEQRRPHSPSTNRRSTSPSAGRGGMGLRFEIGPSGSRRTLVVGGENMLGRERDRHRPNSPPRLSEYIRANEREREGAPNGSQIAGSLMAQYLMAVLSRGPGGTVNPLFADFANITGVNDGGPGAGRMGDYVFTQEALDQILSQLMEGSNANRPVPATEDITKNLPRDVLSEGDPLLEKDCAVCKDQFSLQDEDPNNKVVVTLPCKHPFHEGCILPWLKSSGTCPVCRHALVPQPNPEASGYGPRPPGSPDSGSSSQRNRSPGRGEGSGGAGHSLFSAFFGNQRNSSGAGRTSGRNRATSDPRHGSGGSGRAGSGSSGRHIPGEWDDSVD